MFESVLAVLQDAFRWFWDGLVGMAGEARASMVSWLQDFMENNVPDYYDFSLIFAYYHTVNGWIALDYALVMLEAWFYIFAVCLIIRIGLKLIPTIG